MTLLKKLCAVVVPAFAALALAGAPQASAARLTAPTNLHVVSATDTDIVLAWDAASGAVNYDLFFDDNPTPFIVGTETQFDVTNNQAIGMVPGSTHTFQVRAEDRSGNQTFSNKLTASFAPGDNTPPTAPSKLHVVSVTSSGVELAWNASTDESSFDYHVQGGPCPSPLVVSQSSTHVVVPSIEVDPVCGLLHGSRYAFVVWARDEFGNDSAFSNTVRVNFP